MRIIFDGRIFSQQRAGGISKYWSKLLDRFASDQNNSDVTAEVIFFGAASENIYVPELMSQITSSQYMRMIFFTPLFFLKQLFFAKRDLPKGIFHSPYMLNPFMGRKYLRVLTVHDLIHKKFKPASLRGVLRSFAVDLSILCADAYICVSHSTKDELQKYFPSTKKKPTKVIYHGIDEDRTNHGNSMSLSRKYVLFIGQRSGYKNFSYVLDAMRDKKEVELVCVGGGVFTESEINLIEKFDRSTLIRHVSNATDQELMSWYQGALLLAYPSKIEGFGMPILEAMAVGCPVACANVSSMKEVSARLNYEIDLDDPNSLAMIIDRLLKNGLNDTEKLALINHAHEFSWQKAWKETKAFYVSLCN